VARLPPRLLYAGGLRAATPDLGERPDQPGRGLGGLAGHAAARDDNRPPAPANHPGVDEQAVARPKGGEQLGMFVEHGQHWFKVSYASTQK
jgi:hypothetical protein